MAIKLSTVDNYIYWLDLMVKYNKRYTVDYDKIKHLCIILNITREDIIDKTLVKCLINKRFYGILNNKSYNRNGSFDKFSLMGVFDLQKRSVKEIKDNKNYNHFNILLKLSNRGG
jgi:hypothetical protein